MTSTAPRPSLPPPSSDSDSDADSDSTPTAAGAESLRHNDLSDSIFRSYIELSGVASPDLSKIRSFLTSSRSGALSCLICLERIRSSDPTWSCSSRCFAVFHLLCIQSWARQACDLAAARAATRLPISASQAAANSLWNCPKCRVDYSRSLIPKHYLCFCGKLQDPPSDPWILPHSCGEICDRPLKHNCGHHCLLLCHPGPCPSCPKLVKSRCFCGAVEDVRRCGFKNFSCNGVCSKLLDCGTHRCGETCHDGECPPCRARGIYRCQCGKVEEEKQCCDRSFQCDAPCERMLGCGKHLCSKGCHSGDCGQCPLQGKRTCPCGKRIYQGMACDVASPLCGATCDKMLSCGFHSCPERCHRGPCIETCRTVVTKSCRCGSLKKEVPCYQDLVCERKCQRVRDCGRHGCKRRCCDGDCLPCSEVCDRRLRCKNHKCPAPCHRGPCAPCPVMVIISCACGETHFEVPCGTEKEQKPPKCPKPCSITPLCRHAPICKMICSDKAEFSCNNLCGNLLQCGNHYCTKTCHALKSQFSSLGQRRRAESCEECDLPCQKGRQLSCPHPCPRPCHPGECPPCKVLIKRSCHCGSMVHVFECLYYNSMSKEEQMTARSCGGPCHRKLPYCTHLCPERCHPGQCPAPEKCSKKVTVRCGCQTLKKEWLCQDVQAAYCSAGTDLKDISKNQYGMGFLPCNSDCRSKVKVAEPELQHRKSKIVEEPDAGNHVSKRRKRRERAKETKQISRLQRITAAMWRLFLVVTLVLVLTAAMYYGYKGLLWLSDWMNEVERQRIRYQRI
ncbi:NF-X1-type zinc finger protein NFXL2 isoform X2 [Diospyros lotus]|uniref:NF-X1-type zinc finger protein NFXL2 isoform X2 n=1 Tax=Diospyros lotus TaxID=55363 RepID=UPI0022501503|nr:NF-X1-type zinc finger protein NFXL2 isoform X2 [Diospyros lotus]